jgi:hypothetical protein
MPYFKMEINFEVDSEREASDIESQCYQIVKDAVGDYNKITMDLVFEIDEDEKNL